MTDLNEHVLIDVDIILGGYDLSPWATEIALDVGGEKLEATNFRSGRDRKFLAGAKGAGFAMGVNISSDADGTHSEPVGFARLGEEDVLSIMSPGSVEGRRSYTLTEGMSQFTQGADFGALGAGDISGSADGVVYFGNVLGQGTKSAGSANGTAFQLGAVPAGSSLYSWLHVTGLTGTSPTLDVTIESDDAEGFPSAVTKVTFTQATATGVVVGTPVAGLLADEWFRYTYTVGGSASPTATLWVVAAIRPTV